MKKHYYILGLKEGASQEEIQEAYERLSKELDPANNNNQEFFIEEFKKVQEAYKALSNTSILATDKGAKQIVKKETYKQEMTNKDVKKNRTKFISILKKIFIIIISLTLIVTVSIIGFLYVEDIGSRNPDSNFFSFYTVVSDTQNTVKVEGLRYNMDNMTLFTGVYRRKYDEDSYSDINYDTNTHYEYLNGKIHGYYYGWTYKGWIARGNYRKGEKHGLFEQWHENGQLKSRGNYSNGEIIGKLERWAIDGKPIL